MVRLYMVRLRKKLCVNYLRQYFYYYFSLNKSLIALGSLKIELTEISNNKKKD